MELYDKQKIIVDDYPNKHGLWCDPGTGKTAMSLSIAKKIGKPFVVVCPKSLPENWEREVKLWYPEAKDYTIISKENFVKKCKDIKASTVIIDESHIAFHSEKTIMYKAMKQYLKENDIKDLLMLTGTPLTATYWSVYSAANLMGKCWNYIKFRNKFFKQVKMGFRYVWLPKKDDETKTLISNVLKSIGYTLSMSELKDVPEQNYIYEYFDMNAEQRRQYILCSDPNPAVFHTKKQQVESGAVKTNGYKDDLIIDCDKTTRVIELCEEHKKIIVVARFNLQLETYCDLAKKMFPDRAIDMVNGDTKNKQTIFDKHRSAKENILFINAACSAGYNLPEIPVMVFASMSFKYLDYKQMHARIQRANGLKVNTYIYFITRKHNILGESTDARVNEAMKDGKDFNDNIFYA